ncbi:MAG: hypothetical protein AB7W16_00730 [Candidatus Obscuribacterales bacterium]
MEKLVIHLLAADIVEHLYNWNNGFVPLKGTIVCPASDVIHLLLTSVRPYRIQCSGALSMTESGDRTLRSITIAWKSEACDSKTEPATLSLIDPDKPESASVISVEMGIPSIRIDLRQVGQPNSATVADSMPEADDRPGIAAMLMDATDRLFFRAR